jgi:starch synthase
LDHGPELAQRAGAGAGADLLVLSMFEPCGLDLVIGMRYGTVLVVPAVGGMADTVFDRDYPAPAGRRNGYVFHQADDPAIESALSRTLGRRSG